MAAMIVRDETSKWCVCGRPATIRAEGYELVARSGNPKGQALADARGAVASRAREVFGAIAADAASLLVWGKLLGEALAERVVGPEDIVQLNAAGQPARRVGNLYAAAWGQLPAWKIAPDAGAAEERAPTPEIEGARVGVLVTKGGHRAQNREGVKAAIREAVSLGTPVSEEEIERLTALFCAQFSRASHVTERGFASWIVALVAAANLRPVAEREVAPEWAACLKGFPTQKKGELSMDEAEAERLVHVLKETYRTLEVTDASAAEEGAALAFLLAGAGWLDAAEMEKIAALGTEGVLTAEQLVSYLKPATVEESRPATPAGGAAAPDAVRVG